MRRPERSGSRRLTIRMRLTLTYAGLVTACGAALIALVSLYMRFVPNYQISPMTDSPLAPPYDLTEVSGSTEGVEITTVEDFLSTLFLASVLALVVLALLSGITGWVIAGRVLSPLATINSAATRAATGALDHRVALGGPRDEIRDLSDTFDGMLASLERAFAARQRFAANASHELRTPLATTKAMIDIVLDDPGATTEDLRALALRVADVNRANIETVDALLDLADADRAAIGRAPVELGELTRAVVAELADEADRLRVDLRPPVGRATASGNPVLLRQALSNVVRNAVRHNVPGGHVVVHVAPTDTGARVVVENSGSPLAQADVDTLVEPFVRGRGRGLTRGAGHGLGLAIVDAIVGAHGGTLELRANAGGGLTAVIELPGDEVPVARA